MLYICFFCVFVLSIKALNFWKDNLVHATYSHRFKHYWLESTSKAKISSELTHIGHHCCFIKCIMLNRNSHANIDLLSLAYKLQ